MPRHPHCDQAPYAARFDWGEAGIAALAPRADVLVIVDVLSFSTAVEVAVARGATIYPYPFRDATAADFAAHLDATLAVDRQRAAAVEGAVSLSPPSMATLRPGARVVLPSPNGSALTVLAAELQPTVLAGCLRNARAVAAAAGALGARVAVIAAGERWPDSATRFAVEDLLGAGAILSQLPHGNRSPEAEVAVAAYQHLGSDLLRHLRGCASGRELESIGFAEDVRMAAQGDVSDAVPILREGAYVRHL